MRKTALGVLGALAAAAAYLALGGSRYYEPPGSQRGYAPEQPVPFSHALHAGKLNISCLYCHGGAAKSDVAGMPAVNVCMNCHAAVQQTADGKPLEGLAPLLDAWQRKDQPNAPSIEWVRVHRLPSYARFSHRAHVANNIRCEQCHGPVQGMERMRQFAPLTMGWCVQCHRSEPGARTASWKHVGGPLDCAACHR